MPVLSFNLPPDPPKKAQAAIEHFDDVAMRYAALLGELEDARVAVNAGKVKDSTEMAAAFARGEDAVLKSTHADKAQAALDGIAGTLKAVEPVVDEAGNAMLEAVAEVRDEWVASLEKAAEKHLAAYRKAVAAAQEALAPYTKLQGAIVFLDDFDAGEARIGRMSGWHGQGRVRVRSGGWHDEEHDPGDLLTLVAKVGEEER